MQHGSACVRTLFEAVLRACSTRHHYITRRSSRCMWRARIHCGAACRPGLLDQVRPRSPFGGLGSPRTRPAIAGRTGVDTCTYYNRGDNHFGQAHGSCLVFTDLFVGSRATCCNQPQMLAPADCTQRAVWCLAAWSCCFSAMISLSRRGLCARVSTADQGVTWQVEHMSRHRGHGGGSCVVHGRTNGTLPLFFTRWVYGMLGKRS